METNENYLPSHNTPQKWSETLQDAGFHVGKIDTNTLDSISKFGLTIKNGRIKWEWVVVLNSDDQFNASMSINGWSYEVVHWWIFIDKWTKELKVFWLRQDWLNNPNAPLRIQVINSDGTTDNLIFEKSQAKQIDKFLESYQWKPSDLFNSKELKPQFDAIVNNWMTISDGSVRKFKDLIRIYAWQYGGKLPENFKLTKTKSADGHPWFIINWYGNSVIYNPGTTINTNNPSQQAILNNGNPESNESNKQLKTSIITLEDWRNIELVRDFSKDTYDNYSHIILDGRRYDVIPESIMRMRNGGTTYSTYKGYGKEYKLHQPTFNRPDLKPTLTQQ